MVHVEACSATAARGEHIIAQLTNDPHQQHTGPVSNALFLYLDGLVEEGRGIVVLDQGVEGGHLRLPDARTDAALEGKDERVGSSRKGD